LYIFIPLRQWIDVDIRAFTAAVRNVMYGKGSLIPLRKFEVQGIIKKSSRGRVVFPPVRYWLGKFVASSVLFLLCYTILNAQEPRELIEKENKEISEAEVEVEELTVEDVQKAIGNLKNNKAAGTVESGLSPLSTGALYGRLQRSLA
jgi:predicted transcriptional regulator